MRAVQSTEQSVMVAAGVIQNCANAIHVCGKLDLSTSFQIEPSICNRQHTNHIFSLKMYQERNYVLEYQFCYNKNQRDFKNRFWLLGVENWFTVINFLRLFISEHFLEQCVQVHEKYYGIYFTYYRRTRSDFLKIRIACHRVTWEVYDKCRSQVSIPDLLFQSLNLRPRDFHFKENIYNIDQMFLIYLRFGSTGN